MPAKPARLATVLVLALGFLFVPGTSSADHVFNVPDAKDCAQSAPGAIPVTTDPDEPDRGAACVSDGNASNGPEYYLGGEAATEKAYPGEDHEAGESCGAVVVGGEVLSATRSDDPGTNANESLDWDWIHTHSNGSKHHHTCE